MFSQGSVSFVCFVVLWFCFLRSAGGTQRRTDEEETEGTIRMRSRYRNWCQYTVWKTVPYLTYNSTGAGSHRSVGSCPGLYPCPKFFRMFVRPMYRLSYKQVTASEWRCCPGFHGDSCQQGCFNCTNLSHNDLRLRSLSEQTVWQTQNAAAAAPVQPVSKPGMRPADNGARPRSLFRKPHPIGLPVYLGLAGASGQKGSPGLKGEPGKIETVRNLVGRLEVELKLLAQRVLLLESKMNANDVLLESGSGSDSVQDGSWLEES